MGEYYTMTRDERFADLLKQAVTYIVQGQAPDGGWNYNYSKEPNSDTSVSGWQIQALKAAHLTGLGIPGVDESLDKAMLDLKRVQKEDGSFGYRKPSEGRYSLTGVGVLCTYFWKQDKDKVVKDGLEFMLGKSEKDHPVKYKSDNADLYAWIVGHEAVPADHDTLVLRQLIAFHNRAEAKSRPRRRACWPSLPPSSLPPSGLPPAGRSRSPAYPTAPRGWSLPTLPAPLPPAKTRRRFRSR